MRLQFPTMDLPRRAARTLHASINTPGLKLAAVQEALSRALGYQDWHDLGLNHDGETAVLFDNAIPSAPNRDIICEIIESISAELGCLDGDVLYGLSKSHMLGEGTWPLAAHLRMRTHLWHRAGLGVKPSFESGSMVQMNKKHDSRIGYILRSIENNKNSYRIKPTYDFDVIFDTIGQSLPKSHMKVITDPDSMIVPERHYLPYRWDEQQDGSHIVLSRDYLTLWRLFDGKCERMLPSRQYKGRSFAGSKDLPIVSKTASPQPGFLNVDNATAFLKKYRITGLPVLADITFHAIMQEKYNFQNKSNIGCMSEDSRHSVDRCIFDYIQSIQDACSAGKDAKTSTTQNNPVRIRFRH